MTEHQKLYLLREASYNLSRNTDYATKYGLNHIDKRTGKTCREILETNIGEVNRAIGILAEDKLVNLTRISIEELKAGT